MRAVDGAGLATDFDTFTQLSRFKFSPPGRNVMLSEFRMRSFSCGDSRQVEQLSLLVLLLLLLFVLNDLIPQSRIDITYRTIYLSKVEQLFQICHSDRRGRGRILHRDQVRRGVAKPKCPTKALKQKSSTSLLFFTCGEAVRS